MVPSAAYKTLSKPPSKLGTTPLEGFQAGNFWYIILIILTCILSIFLYNNYNNIKEYTVLLKDTKLLNNAIGRYTLSKKQITKKLEEKEDNPEFLEKLLRSIENNIKDKKSKEF